MKTLKNVLNKIYFIYLGLLPAVVTFFLIQNIETIQGKEFLIFIIGIIVVSVYLAFIVSYIKPINNIRRVLLIIIDGPIFALIGSLNNIDIPTIIMATFLIENVAIWISIGVLTVTSQEANRAQVIGSIILTILSIGGLGIVYYASGFFEKVRYRYIPIVVGMIETIGFAYKTLHKDEVVDDNIGYIIGFPFLWIAFMSIGIGIHK